MYELLEIRRAITNKGYPLPALDIPSQVILIGIRHKDKAANHFDDLLHVIHIKGKNVFQYEFPFTTDPGLYWLKNPMKTKGTAILVEGHYEKLWKIGSHRGQYNALVQASPCKVYRDNNKDDIIDCNIDTIQQGIFGINMHRSNPYTESYYVDKWSAGCQVFKEVKDFDFTMNLCEEYKKKHENFFDYFLLNQKDFE